MRKRDYTCALGAFLEARSKAPGPHAVAEIGFAEQAMGRWVDAEAHLIQALELPDDPNDPWMEKGRTAIDQSLKMVRTHIGGLALEGSPHGAEIQVDGRPLDYLPLRSPLRIEAGKHLIKLLPQKAGYEVAETTVDVQAEKTASARLDCAVARSPEVPLALAPTRPIPTVRPANASETFWSAALPWVGTAGGLYAAAEGTAIVMNGLSARDRCPPGQNCGSDGGRVVLGSTTFALGAVAGTFFASELLLRAIAPDHPHDGSDRRYLASPALLLSGCALAVAGYAVLAGDGYDSSADRPMAYGALAVAPFSILFATAYLVSGNATDSVAVYPTAHGATVAGVF